MEGVPAGLLDDREYEEVTFDAKKGDLIVLYSDGVTDQQNPAEEEYERHNLGRALRKLCGQDPQTVADGILADLDEFANGAPMNDDQTLVVLRVR